MSSTSEATFGQRYQHGLELLAFVEQLDPYQPPNPDLSPDALRTLLDQINNANAQVTTTSLTLATQRQQRQDGFYGPQGLKKRAAMIRDFFGSLPEGKTSLVYKAIQQDSQKKYNNRKTSSRTDDSTPDTPPKRSPSQAETSFGSLLQSGKTILTTLRTQATYAPVNPLITTDGFATFLQDLEDQGEQISVLVLTLEREIHDRRQLYEDLRQTFTQIKSYIAATYSKSSPEYDQAVAIKY